LRRQLLEDDQYLLRLVRQVPPVAMVLPAPAWDWLLELVPMLAVLIFLPFFIHARAEKLQYRFQPSSAESCPQMGR